MWRKELLWIFFLSVGFLNSIKGCQIEGIPNTVLVDLNIMDTDRNEFRRYATSNLIGIISASHTGNPLQRGPYVQASFENNELVLTLLESFAEYEEYEISDFMPFNIQLSCGGGSTRTIVFNIYIQDTNNNLPHFLPSNEHSYTVTTPLAPGFELTGCSNHIVVRDIDLTTQRIEFGIADNPYFEIFYDSVSTIANSKTFNGILRTKAFVRSIPEPIRLEITATDVDNTGDDPHTVTGYVTIEGNNEEFELPDELVFSETYYEAQYTVDDRLQIDQIISLRQGYDAEVSFTLTGSMSNHFTLTGSGNTRSIEVIEPLPQQVISSNAAILLIVNAERDLVIDATATVVIELPEGEPIQFEYPIYEGSIIDNELSSTILTLTQGYQNGFNIEIISDYDANFDYEISDNNVITLTMTPLDQDILQRNSFIAVEVRATSATSTANTVLNLNIIKDDMNTPVFENNIYYGTYDLTTGLDIQEIALSQGFDESVQFILEGDDSNHFELIPNSNSITLIPNITTDVIENTQILVFSIFASKARTVGARTTVSISLPEEETIQFEHSIYEGSIIDNELNSPILRLTQGYQNGFIIEIISDYDANFGYEISEDNLIILIMTPLDQDILQRNSFIAIEVRATSATSTATTVLNLNIIKDDMNTPVFENNIYYGTYDLTTGLDIQEIALSQGFDESVQFILEGDDSNHFELIPNSNSITLIPNITTDVIENSQILVFSIFASKPRTVGASTTVSISLPEGETIQFEHSIYEGSIIDNELNSPSLRLTQGYQNGFNIEIISDYDSNFDYTISDDNVITLTMTPLDQDILQRLSFIAIQVRANSATSTATAVLNLNIIKDDINTPMFEDDIYYGTYDLTTGLDIKEIALSQGFDESVQFTLAGDDSDHFELIPNSNSVTLIPNITTDVIENAQILIFSIFASKPRTVGASATVSISLPEGETIQFEHSIYEGSIIDNELNSSSLRLTQGYQNGFNIEIISDYDSNFDYVISDDNEITLTMTPLDQDILQRLSFIAIQVRANSATSTATAVLNLNIIKDDINTPMFEDDIYYGTYDLTTGLDIKEIALSQGFDESVQFTLAGDDSNHFELIPNINSVMLIPNFPTDLIENEQILIFSILATKPRTVGASTTVLITLPAEPLSALRFEFSYYAGSIENNTVNLLNTIQLRDGPTEGITYELVGDLANLFRLNNDSTPMLTLELTTPLPEPIDPLVLLEVRASGINYLEGVTVIVLDTKLDQNVILSFTEAYYSGTYIEETVLDFPEIILAYADDDNSVELELIGDDAEWFTFTREDYIITLEVIEPGIPLEVLTNNQHLTFSIIAQRPGAISGRAAIIVTLPADNPLPTILTFEENNYVGSIVNESIILDDIYLRDGLGEGLNFELIGDLAYLFEINYDRLPILSLELAGDLPETIDLVVLEIEASGSNVIPAYATIIMERPLNSNIEILSFSEAYYSGNHVPGTDFVFPAIILQDGYDSEVSFNLEGDHAQWFSFDNAENIVTLQIRPPGIPLEVLINNQHLTFSIIAERVGAISARAAIVIGLPEENPTPTILRFDESIYRGSIVNDSITLDDLYLRDGQGVGLNFELGGDLAHLFEINYDRLPILSLELAGDLPETIDLVVLEIEASGSNVIPAYATIILERPLNSNIEILSFSEAYYSGNHVPGTDFLFPAIILQDGYDSEVSFDLEGDHAQWFSFENAENIVTLQIRPPGIPLEVLINNQHLTFSIIAERVGAISARAAIVIGLPEENPTPTILRFDESIYRGSIVNDSITLDDLYLRDGQGVGLNFELGGDLAHLFEINSDRLPILSLELAGDLPETIDLVVLEIEASGSNVIPAYATIILERPLNNNIEILSFSEAYYSGNHVPGTDFVFPAIILQDGYDSEVSFYLEGDHAQWFSFDNAENIVTLQIRPPGIPLEVLINNQHLTFSIIAERVGAISARAAIVIGLPEENPTPTILRFDESIYRGSIVNDSITLDDLYLRDGQGVGLNFELGGDLAHLFEINSDRLPILSLELAGDLPETIDLVVLEIEASGSNVIPAYATIILERPLNSNIEILSFSEAYYSGNHVPGTDFVFPAIILQDGYDSEVSFYLEGDHAQWFSFDNAENIVTLQIRPPGIPLEVLINNQHLTFSIIAERVGAISARAAIVIGLPEENPTPTILRFDESIYRGSIVNDSITLDDLYLRDGQGVGLNFELGGDLAHLFEINSDRLPILSLELAGDLPETIDLVVLEIEASGSNVIPAYATIILERPLNSNIEILSFSEAYYSGNHVPGTDFVFPAIILQDGYDSEVSFDLEGDHAQWFSFENAENIVTLQIRPPGIPLEVLINNQHLTFSIIAERVGAISARAAIVIGLPEENPTPTILRFDESIYRGSIVNDSITLDDLYLRDGQGVGLNFELGGDLAHLFEINSDRLPILSLELAGDLPETIDLVVLEIEASGSNVIPAYATIILERPLNSNIEILSFSEAYYSGNHVPGTDFVFPAIILQDGYDSEVSFDLEGDHAQWFSFENAENIVTLQIRPPGIPLEVLINNQHLTFSIIAERVGAISARAAIVIGLPEENPTPTILRFDESIYRGSIVNDSITLDDLYLRDGQGVGLNFELGGDLAHLFEINSDRLPILSLELAGDLPETIDLVVLEIEASGSNVIPAYATIILERPLNSNIEILTFSEAYYSGNHVPGTDFVFPAIILQDGYDSEVSFDLEGDHAQWFSFDNAENIVTLQIRPPGIPLEVLINNQHLTFSIIAERVGAISARAAIVIGLPEENPTPTILRFDENIYRGSIVNDSITLDDLYLRDGQGVGLNFELGGDLAHLFEINSDRLPILSLELAGDLPETIDLVVLEIEASGSNVIPAYATIILEKPLNSNIEILSFSEAYYSGNHVPGTDFVFPAIILQDGYDSEVSFYLEGDHAQWFSFDNAENIVTLQIRPPGIPLEVLINNQHLTFSIIAERVGAISARAAIVIGLPEENPTPTILRFDESIYRGSIVNDSITLDDLYLRNGQGVGLNFELGGDLAHLFEINSDRLPILSLELAGDLPETIDLVVLEIEASGSNVIPAYATIILEKPLNSNIEILSFSEAYYSGNHVPGTDFVFPAIILQDGYDSEVSFDLEGDHAQWFSFENAENIVTLQIRPPGIPLEVLINNQHLTFSIIAERVGAISARAAIVIGLPEENPTPTILRFDESIYRGSIVNDSITLDDLYLRDGQGVGLNFELGGDLAHLFEINSDRLPILSLELAGDLPETIDLVVLEIEASGSNVIPAYATIILEKPLNSNIEILSFSEAYYSGNHVPGTDFVFPAIILQDGYDSEVSFDLEGDHAQWFSFDNAENIVTLQIRPPGIPLEVLINNQHLTFSIIAERVGAISARAAIVIGLPEENPTPTILRFDESIYRGSIVNDSITLDDLYLRDGQGVGLNFELGGDLAHLFEINSDRLPILSLEQAGDLPETIDLVVLEIEASGSNVIPAYATIILEKPLNSNIEILSFSEAYYSGNHVPGTDFVFPAIILQDGYDSEVSFDLEGDHAQWFSFENAENIVTLQIRPPGIPLEVLINNQHLTFSIIAERVGAISARAAIVIGLPEENPTPTILRFDESIYRGSIVNDSITLDDLYLRDGQGVGLNFELGGDLAHLFEINSDRLPILSLELAGDLPETIDLVVLEIEASGSNVIPAYATIILEKPLNSNIEILSFSEAYYSGNHVPGTDFVFPAIILQDGYDSEVSFYLEGDHAQWFSFENAENIVTLQIRPPGIPLEVLINNQHLTFSIIAERVGAISARAAIVIGLPEENPTPTILRFDESIYRGSIVNDSITLDDLYLRDGQGVGLNFELGGDLAYLFEINSDRLPILSLELAGDLPETIDLVVLEIEASGSNVIPAYATIILERPLNSNIEILSFSEAYYSGNHVPETDFVFPAIILQDGYDSEVSFDLEGDHAQWFSFENAENIVTLQIRPPGIPLEVLINNQHLTFSIIAERVGAISARAAIVIGLPEENPTPTILRFDESIYRGSIVNDSITLDDLYLRDGQGVGLNFELGGDLAHLFEINSDRLPILSLELAGDLPETMDLIVLEIEASGSNVISAYATIILERPLNSNIEILSFSEVYYSSNYVPGTDFVFPDIILQNGYDSEVSFDLEGDHAQWFSFENAENIVTLQIRPPGIPLEVLINNQHLTFSIIAERVGAISARAVIVIGLRDGPVGDIFFDSALYQGVYELGVIQHDNIRIIGFLGNDVLIIGEHSELFIGNIENGEVYIRVRDDTGIPLEVNHIALELRADSARTALVLTIHHIDENIPPSVEFNPSSYVFRVDISQTGFIGRVEASANNDESLRFSLQTDNDEVAERLSINGQGELHLSAPAPSGQYNFNIIATTVVSGISATANAQLLVDAITVCGTDDRVVPPLIILERDEEERHDNLVVLNNDLSSECWYTMNNRWPLDQNWLSVDERGLHAAIIDREHESIAFMVSSQIQVELVLHCNSDENSLELFETQAFNSGVFNITRYNSNRSEDYGLNRWILTDTILYNSRRSLVNLIVRDINDNPPLFVGKENEPLIFGYPIHDLVDIIMPRSLAEVKATDADIGENAKLVYWSDETKLAISRESGTVHIRNNMGQLLEDGEMFTISATDRNGASDGLVGHITIQIRLLDVINIAVLTIHNALLDDEQIILENISETIGYDVKILRSSVVADEFEEVSEMLNNRNNNEGASLQLYVYGLRETIPVEATVLISDINNNEISSMFITNGIPLEDHIEHMRNPPPGRDIGLLAATIVLSVLLFLLILFVIVWYIFKMRKAKNYEKFSDTNSIISEKVTSDLSKLPHDSLARTKMNIEELKKSERRLQERLNAPDEEPKTNTSIPVVPLENTAEVSTDTIIDISPVENSGPIVIQSIDKLKDPESDGEEEDEFGEIKPTKKRKSVVTFNQNVEKIIHVEDNVDDADYEIDRL